MKIYNQDKTEIIENYDITKGYLVQDKLTIHHDKIEKVQEVGHYETVNVYPNGGKDVKWVVDEPGVDEVEAYDEIEDINIFIPYTEEEIAEREKDMKLFNLQEQLASTDYEAIKYAEGWFTEEEYAPIKAQREELRRQIREIID